MLTRQMAPLASKSSLQTWCFYWLFELVLQPVGGSSVGSHVAAFVSRLPEVTSCSSAAGASEEWR